MSVFEPAPRRPGGRSAARRAEDAPDPFGPPAVSSEEIKKATSDRGLRIRYLG